MKNGFNRTLVLVAVLCSAVASASNDAPMAAGGGDGDTIATNGTPNSITDSGAHSRRGGFVGLLELPYAYYGLGIGVALRYNIPILPDGFINGVNDSVELEPGVNIDYGFGNGNFSYLAIVPQINATWTFHFSDKFAAYALLGLGVGLNIWTYDQNLYYGIYSTPVLIYPYIDPAVGIKFKLNPGLELRVELGRALRVGFQF